MHPLKIAVIGGGSTYTPELIEGFLEGMLPVREIVLMDIDVRKLGIVGGLAQRMAAGTGVEVTLSAERASALDGADVVIAQIRVGGLNARILDERIPLSHGLIGQETTGPGGFASALRTIPVMLDISREMQERCPDAWLINFTNPSGLITEALRLHGHDKVVGLCNYPLTLKMKVAQALDVDESRLELAYFGLNHLSWTRVAVDGQDRTGEVLEVMMTHPKFRDISGYAFDPTRLRELGMIPSGYLRYYYDTAKMVCELNEAAQTRGERVRDVEARLLDRYANSTLCEKPAELQERGGAWYSTAAVRLVHDLWSETGGVHVLNIPNERTMSLLPDHVVVEIPAYVAKGQLFGTPTVTQVNGEHTLGGNTIPLEIYLLLNRVKNYELLTVNAAITGSRELAAEALESHPLLDGRHADIPTLLDELLLAHHTYLPLFFCHK